MRDLKASLKATVNHAATLSHHNINTWHKRGDFNEKLNNNKHYFSPLNCHLLWMRTKHLKCPMTAVCQSVLRPSNSTVNASDDVDWISQIMAQIKSNSHLSPVSVSLKPGRLTCGQVNWRRPQCTIADCHSYQVTLDCSEMNAKMSATVDSCEVWDRIRQSFSQVYKLRVHVANCDTYSDSTYSYTMTVTL